MRQHKYRARQMHTNEWHYFSLQQLWFLGEASAFYADWSEWTGLKDKNGKEIYEGDIVRVVGSESNNLFMVRWYADSFARFELMWPRGVTYMKGESFDNYRMDWNDLMVIGNIYENEDLLANKDL